MRVLILSDIHANIVALESVLNAVQGQYDVVWCLGDIVGYGPRPNECVALIQDVADICVMGNHDWAVLGRPGVLDDFNPQARQAVHWTQTQISETSRAYLDSLSDVPIRPIDALNLLITHASPREPVCEYVLTPSIAMENFSTFTEEVCLVGHTHRPAIYRWRLQSSNKATRFSAGSNHVQTAIVDYLSPQAGEVVKLETSSTQRLIVNPGSVGQPRDNDARAAYAILDVEKMVWLYERVPYPIELTQSQMRSADLPKRLSDRLSFGW